jgi:hypothetical protein
MFKLLSVICLSVSCIAIMLSAGCGKRPDTSTGNSNASSGGPSQPNSQLQPLTVDNVNLKPANPIPGLEILVPEGFTKMDEALLQVKYPNANRPTLVFTNADGTINLAINHTSSAVAPNQLEQLHQQLDTSIRQAQPNANWMFSGFQNYHGRRWTQLEFQSDAVDTKIHNMMIATSAQGRMLAISFNCTDAHAKTWMNVGREIIKSAVFTD